MPESGWPCVPVLRVRERGTAELRSSTGGPASGNRRYLTEVAACITIRHTGTMGEGDLGALGRRGGARIAAPRIDRPEPVGSDQVVAARIPPIGCAAASNWAAEVAALEADADDRSEMLEGRLVDGVAACSGGDVYRFKVPKGVGHEQQGERYGVVVQFDVMLPRSVVIVAPTSRSARPASFRPEVKVAGSTTRVLVEQLGAVDAQRLGLRMERSRLMRCGRSTKLSSSSWASTNRRGSAARRAGQDRQSRAPFVGGRT